MTVKPYPTPSRAAKTLLLCSLHDPGGPAGFEGFIGAYMGALRMYPIVKAPKRVYTHALQHLCRASEVQSIHL